MKWNYDNRYPSMDDVRQKARKKIPRFAFEYLDGGCNEDVNLEKNTQDLRKVELKPHYLKQYAGCNLQTNLLGEEYAAPFGIAPVGLQGLMWPDAPRILAKAAVAYNIPFILSTVTTASIEEIAAITEGRFWFQLYHPADNHLRDDLLRRAASAGCKVLVILADVPTFGFRPRDIRNGLAVPPRMTFRNMLQIAAKPHWALQTLLHGVPAFKTMQPYMPPGLSMKQLGIYMNQTFNGRLDEEKLQQIREKWKGKLVLKGVASAEDTETAIRLGIDGVIVSNHGGRQLDAGESAIHSLLHIAELYKQRITVMMDSGIRSGVDVARVLACGAEFTFLGRSFMYGAAALGKKGGEHTIALLKTQLQQVMEQVCCHSVNELPSRLIK